MKLRVKLQRQSQVIDFEQREPSSITFRELKTVVSSRFALEEYDFQLSLNKLDSLSSDDEQTLSSAGIVSGDLLHIIGSNLPEASPVSNESLHLQPMGLSTTHEASDLNAEASDVSMITVTSSSSETEQEKKDTDMNNDDTAQPNQDDPPGLGVQVNRFLLEPLVVRESTATQVPVLLEQLYDSASCNCVADAVVVVLHTLMLESGFVPQQVVSNEDGYVQIQ
ncbi:F-box only protein 7 [Elysia marginata]|uniref:F-box only protein 7 n=1 Tax=Elysia marginata TaxID=1093978 RepID=A0AAV4F9S3_9GAST|nr:F-box only protein 7 [Elysia marginata]